MTKHPTAKTSVPQIPAAYTEPGLAHVYRDTRNLDYGCGRYDNATEFLSMTRGCLNYRYDPHCRTPEQNLDALISMHASGELSVISCLNVLNILLDKKDRDEAVEAIKYLTGVYGTVKHVVFQVWEGNKSGKPNKSQMNQLPSFYWDDLRKELPDFDFELLGGSKKNIIHFWRD